MAGEMRGERLLILACLLFFCLAYSHGDKQEDLDRLIKGLKGESDQVANEIYTWIGQQRKGFRTHDHARENPARGHSKKEAKKEDLELLIKTFKGESDHLANELYAWIDDHGKSRDQLRTRRDVEDVGNAYVNKSSNEPGLGGESIQDVMLDLMSAPHPNVEKKTGSSTKKSTNISGETPGKKSKKSSVKKRMRKSTKRGKKKKKRKIAKLVKRVKQVKHVKRSKILKKKSRLFTHAQGKAKKKYGFADLLKVLSASPAKKIVVTKGDINADQKSLKIIKKIPKSVLKKLIENINLDKYFKMATYLPNDKETAKAGKGAGESRVKNKKNLKKKSILKTKDVERRKKIALKKFKGNRKNVKRMEENGKKSGKNAAMEIKLTKRHGLKSLTKKVLNGKVKKLKVEKSKIKDHKAHTKNNISVPDSKNEKKKDGKQKNVNKSHLILAHKKLSSLKEKIKKTNSLKLKVAKALLDHCATQNKLKAVFNNVNASLKQAAILAKAIGKKWGVKREDIESLTSAHTEEAVEQFLNKIF